jgi:subtilase family serine protease
MKLHFAQLFATAMCTAHAFTSSTAARGENERTYISERVEPKHGLWEGSVANIGLSETVTFTIYMKQNGLDELNELFYNVSDPTHEKYGQFLSKSELDEIVKAVPNAFEKMDQWFEDAGTGDETKIETTSDSMRVITNVEVATKLFQTKFRKFTHVNGNSKILADGVVSVPANLIGDYIEFIGGLTEMWHYKDIRKLGRQRNTYDGRYGVTDPDDLDITPDLLRTYYDIPKDETNASPEKNYQAIAAFNDYYNSQALSKFNAHFDLPSPTIVAEGVNCLHATKPCDEVESDLDVQYITSIASNTKTLFHNQNDGWVLEFSEDAQKIEPMPLVFSISYGWAELRQCDIAFEKCDTLGYDSRQYVNRANTGFQKLAVMGVSVIVADGDDGAQSSSPNGADPIDPNRWCGASPYACYPKTSSECTEILLTNTSLRPKQSCPWPVGQFGELCEFLFLGDFYQDEDIVKALKNANPTCGIQIFYDGSLGVHLYSSCKCSELSPLYHEGVVSEPYKFNQSARVFYADFPTVSPFVTSVGATMFKSNDGKTVHSEHAASIADGAIITTGGGFSAVADQPSWQKNAVENWVKNAPEDVKPPSYMYDATKRGYPDVSLNGHNYQVAYTDSDSGEIKIGGVDGTSASTPAFAGMISLVNGHLLASGKTSLGFLNPFLYQMSAASTTTTPYYTDITYGDNKCTRNFCMEYGYNATAGWDPVAGLGSPKYTNMKAYALKVKGV